MSFLEKFTKTASNFEKEAVENFRRYLQIPTVHPNVDYIPCVTFFAQQAKDLALTFETYYYYSDTPVIVLTWVGEEPNAPSILLNSHMDVVAADEDRWCYKPFAADVDDDGNIYARGAQDTKGIGIQYLEAIRKLKSKNVKLRRTVHISFVPDEEVGGAKGMKRFVQSEEFKSMNVGFALDEGTPTEKDEFLISYGEKSAHSIIIHCPGQTGHASLLLKNTAGEKLRYLLNKLYELREESDCKVKGDLKAYGEHITVNLTKIEGGSEANVLPSEITLTIDCRLPPTVPIEEWEKRLDVWCQEAGEGVWREYLNGGYQTPITKLDGDKFWTAFKDIAENM
ncbi:hypothetical protein FQA39_LY18407 [Lamprigera yunnana]|nr:hypothetical protein FQA39_LY18407 [Lamprigera yunnana]